MMMEVAVTTGATRRVQSSVKPLSPTNQHQLFYKLDVLLNQQRQSTEGKTQPDAVSNKLS